MRLMWVGISIWQDSEGSATTTCAKKHLPLTHRGSIFPALPAVNVFGSGAARFVIHENKHWPTGPLPLRPALTHFRTTHATNYQYYTGPNFFKIRREILEIKLVNMRNDRCTGVIMRPFYALRRNALAREAVCSNYSLSSVQSNTIPSGFMNDIKPSYSPITNVIHSGLFSLLQWYIL